MAAGINATHANNYLNVLRNVSATGIASVTAKMHTADPGSAGTTAQSANTTGSGVSSAIVFAAASGGSMAYSSGGLFSGIAGLGGNETITHISLWNGATHLWNVALTSSKVIQNGDSFQINSLTLSFTPTA